MCVADRISCFCEAILDVTELCKKNLRCCVAKKLYDNESTPKELIIPKNDARCQDDKAVTDDEEDDLQLSESTTTEVLKPVNKERPPAGQKNPPGPGNDFKEIPPEKRCRGTCVTGFFDQ